MVSKPTVGMLLLFCETLIPTAEFYLSCLHVPCHTRVLMQKLISKFRRNTPNLLTSSLSQIFVSSLKTDKKMETYTGMFMHRFIDASSNKFNDS